MGHLATESFKRRVGADTLTVTYRGTAPGLNDVLGGQVALMMAPLLSVLQHTRGGRLTAFGITSAARSAVAPEIPTLIEGGLADFVFTVWYALWGPRALAAEHVARLNAAAQAAARDEDFIRRLAALGTEPVAEDAASFARHIAAEYARNAAIIRDAGIRPE